MPVFTKFRTKYIKHEFLKAIKELCILVSTLNIGYLAEDAADNFKALARRNGIKVSRPAEQTAENHGATASMLEAYSSI